jgi:hypothetical protein
VKHLAPTTARAAAQASRKPITQATVPQRSPAPATTSS